MKKNVNILEGPIFKNLFLFTIPLILTGIMQLLYNACDIVVVGRFAGSKSLAAVGSTSSLTNLMINLFIGLSTGTCVCVSQFFGANDENSTQKAVHTSIALGLIGGIFLMIVGVMFSKFFLSLMGTPDNIINESALYMRIFFMGMPGNMIYNFGSAVVRASGDTKTPLVYLSFTGLINVILNLIFVIIFKMTASGVALATIISQYISAFLIIRYLYRSNSIIKLHISKIKLHGKTLTRILAIGLPAGIQGMIFSMSNVIIQSSVNSFGSAAVAGQSASGSIEGFCYIAMNSTSQALTTYVGQNVGAGKINRLKKIIICGVMQLMIVGILSCSVIYIFSEPLLSIYINNDAEVMQFALLRNHIIISTYILCGIMEALVGSIRGMGNSLLPTCMSILGVCGVRIGWIFTVFAKYRSLRNLYLSFPVSWAFTSVLQLIVCIFMLKKLTTKYNSSK